jgi:PAS domain S-box-containing protein
LADRAKVMIWTSGPDKLCDWFNRAWLDFTGRTMQQELGDGWAESVYPDDLSRCLSVYTTAFDRREEFSMEYQLRRHDGAYRWILDIGSPYFSAGEEFLGYFGSCIDVTAARDWPQPAQPEYPRHARELAVAEEASVSGAENEAREAPSGAEIRAALERMVISESFQACPRLAAFLRFVIEATLRGESAHLKGYTIAVEALGRGGDFDPQQDPIVRVEAARLRRVIQHYYAGPGAGDFVVVDVPRGHYIPTFHYRPTVQASPIPAAGGTGFLTTGSMGAIPAAVETTGLGGIHLMERPAGTGVAITRVEIVNATFARHPGGDAMDDMPTQFPEYDFLTPRERDVLTRIAAGASSKETGRQLGISFRTVEIHRARIMGKLGAKNAADLVRIVSTRAM